MLFKKSFTSSDTNKVVAIASVLLVFWDKSKTSENILKLAVFYSYGGQFSKNANNAVEMGTHLLLRKERENGSAEHALYLF